MLLRSSGAMHRPWAQDAMRPGAMHRCAERYTPQRYVPAQSYAPAQRRFAPGALHLCCMLRVCPGRYTP